MVLLRDSLQNLINQRLDRIPVQRPVSEQQPQVHGSVQAVEHDVEIEISTQFTALNGADEDLAPNFPPRLKPARPEGRRQLSVMLGLAQERDSHLPQTGLSEHMREDGHLCDKVLPQGSTVRKSKVSFDL